MNQLSIYELFTPQSNWGLWSRQKQLTSQEQAQKDVLEDVYNSLQKMNMSDYTKFKNKFEKVAHLASRSLTMDLSNCQDLGKNGLINIFRHTFHIQKLKLDCLNFDDQTVLNAIPYLKKNSADLGSLHLANCSKKVLSAFLEAFPNLPKLSVESVNMLGEEYKSTVLNWMAQNTMLQSAPNYNVESAEEVTAYVNALSKRVRKFDVVSTSNDVLKSVLSEISKKLGSQIESAKIMYSGSLPPGPDVAVFKNLPSWFPKLTVLKFTDAIIFQSKDILETYLAWKDCGMNKFESGIAVLNDDDMIKMISTMFPKELKIGFYSPTFNYDSFKKIVPILVSQNKLERITLPDIQYPMAAKDVVDPVIQQMGSLFKTLKSFVPYKGDLFNDATLLFIARNVGANLEEFDVRVMKQNLYWELETIREVFVTVGKNCPNLKSLSLSNIVPKCGDLQVTLQIIAGAYHNLEKLNLDGAFAFPEAYVAGILAFAENNPNLHTIYVKQAFGDENIAQLKKTHPELAKRINFVKV